MSRADRADFRKAFPGGVVAEGLAGSAPKKTMTAFVESCVGTIADSAVAAERSARGRPRFGKLLRVLRGKKNILVTTHLHPDPDALASSWALALLLGTLLPDASVVMSIKGPISGGLNGVFVRNSNLKLTPWEDDLSRYDAIILLDVTPGVSHSPLPPEIAPTAVIDHHRTRRRARCAFSDIRPEVGAASSIIFSYYMEVERPISPELGATLLYAIESDLAGAAGQPGELDNIALSSLTLLADTRKLYQMRYADLPRSYYQSYFIGLSNAIYYDNAMISHLDAIESPEKPAVIADFLLRFDLVQFALVTAIYQNKLVISLRTSSKMSAADIMRRLLRNTGNGGGHRTKAGGFVLLETGAASEIDATRKLLERRFLRALAIKSAGKRLVGKE